MLYEARKLQIGATVVALSGLAAERFDDVEHPAYRAYNWIVDDDDMHLCPDDENLLQRYILALLYFTTGGDGWTKCSRDASMPCSRNSFLSDSHECEWGGVTCDDLQQVQKLNLGKPPPPPETDHSCLSPPCISHSCSFDSR